LHADTLVDRLRASGSLLADRIDVGNEHHRFDLGRQRQPIQIALRHMHLSKHD
jgi:hypothetical protein